ncbi:hypothetical protein BE20_04995 [Sorangium cellulosum]|nr:hypothetical protein BE20_04995 [Sorangium cellulosum]
MLPAVVAGAREMIRTQTMRATVDPPSSREPGKSPPSAGARIGHYELLRGEAWASSSWRATSGSLASSRSSSSRIPYMVLEYIEGSVRG